MSEYINPAEVISICFNTAYPKSNTIFENEDSVPFDCELTLVELLLGTCMLRYLIELFDYQVRSKNPSLLDNKIYEIVDTVNPPRYIKPKNPARLKPKPHQFMLILENALNKHYQEQSNHERSGEVFTLWTLVTVLLSHKYFDSVSKQESVTF